MGDTYVISGLIAKRSELAGQLAHHQKQVRELLAALTNVDASIKLFDPDYDLASIKAKTAWHGNPWFEHGATNTLVLDALRSAGTPLSTRQIAEAMLAVKGLTATTAREWETVLNPILSTLKRLQKKGVVKLVGQVAARGGTLVWALS